jgi:hypothetical protein
MQGSSWAVIQLVAPWLVVTCHAVSILTVALNDQLKTEGAVHIFTAADHNFCDARGLTNWSCISSYSCETLPTINTVLCSRMVLVSSAYKNPKLHVMHITFLKQEYRWGWATGTDNIQEIMVNSRHAQNDLAFQHLHNCVSWGTYM